MNLVANLLTMKSNAYYKDSSAHKNDKHDWWVFCYSEKEVKFKTSLELHTSLGLVIVFNTTFNTIFSRPRQISSDLIQIGDLNSKKA